MLNTNYLKGIKLFVYYRSFFVFTYQRVIVIQIVNEKPRTITRTLYRRKVVYSTGVKDPHETTAVNL